LFVFFFFLTLLPPSEDDEIIPTEDPALKEQQEKPSEGKPENNEDSDGDDDNYLVETPGSFLDDTSRPPSLVLVPSEVLKRDESREVVSKRSQSTAENKVEEKTESLKMEEIPSPPKPTPSHPIPETVVEMPKEPLEEPPHKEESVQMTDASKEAASQPKETGTQEIMMDDGNTLVEEKSSSKTEIKDEKVRAEPKKQAKPKKPLRNRVRSELGGFF
jgi:hypothetical protein